MVVSFARAYKYMGTLSELWDNGVLVLPSELWENGVLPSE
jgi:hypothetical protein